MRGPHPVVVAAALAAAVIGSSSALGATASILGSTGANPNGIVVDSAGNVFTANYSGTVTKVTQAGASTNIATGQPDLLGLAVDAADNLFTPSSSAEVVVKVAPAGTASVFATLPTGTGPRGIAVDRDGNVYTANFGTNDVSKIDPLGSVSVFGSVPGSGPQGLAFDGSGNLFVTGSTSRSIWKISQGTSTLFAATGNDPTSIVSDSDGNVYTSDRNDDAVTKVSADGLATSLIAPTNKPQTITIDSAGNLYVANYVNGTVSKITPAGAISVLVSLAPATQPYGITIDSAGNLYTSNEGTANVSKITPVAGDIAPAPPEPAAAPIAVASNGAATVTVTRNAVNARYGAPSSYLVRAVQDPAKQCTVADTGPASCDVVGLTNGTAYTFEVVSRLNTWNSPASPPSSAVTPLTVPGPPQSVTSSAGDGQATVSWTAPASDGGSAITAYTVTASPGGGSCTATAPATNCTVTGLVNGTAYTFTVVATNAAGNSTPSGASAAVTPTAPPSPSPAASCPDSFYQQAPRTWRMAVAPGGASSLRVVSRIRIFQDVQAACRVDLTFIFRDARSKKRLDQLAGSTLGTRVLRGKEFSAPVVSWPSSSAMRFTTGDPTGAARRNARLVLVSYLRRVRGMPRQQDVELLIVRRVPMDAALAASATNPLFAQKNSLRTAVGWATVS